MRTSPTLVWQPPTLPRRIRPTPPIHMLLKDDLHHLCARLERLQDIAWHPLILPLILLEPRTDDVAQDLERIRTSLYDTERTTGTHKNYQNKAAHERKNYYARGEKVWNQGEEFEASPGRLTSIVSECARIDAKCSINENLLEWLDSINRQLEAEYRQGTSAPRQVQARRLVQSKISTMRVWLANNKIRSQYLGKRAEAQMQAVS